MSEEYQYIFSIKRITDPESDESSEALKIYNETTPVSIKTDSNEISYWVKNSNYSSKFKIFVFCLYLNHDIIGMAMISCMKNMLVIDYIAIKENYRKNSTIFFTYINLINNWLNESKINIDYYITEISNKDSGENIDRESKLFKKLFCLDGFGKVDVPYYTLPLNNNPESIFETFLYIKTVDNITSISKKLFLEIINSIYWDYYCEWYEPFMSPDQIKFYKEKANSLYKELEQSLQEKDKCKIIFPHCPLTDIIQESNENSLMLPAIRKRKRWMFPVLIFSIVIAPILIICIYNKTLDWMGIKISDVSIIISGYFIGIVSGIIGYFLSPNKKH